MRKRIDISKELPKGIDEIKFDRECSEAMSAGEFTTYERRTPIPSDIEDRLKKAGQGEQAG